MKRVPNHKVDPLFIYPGGTDSRQGLVAEYGAIRKGDVHVEDGGSARPNRWTGMDQGDGKH